ncbi:hypothetical protein BHE74_00015697 [Ensete ventricosum]|uniref:Uncharacterized protein n=1 Tax=Ensete ventricosum TaxID=4639 RepID=A0A444GFG0_ENSVE|nr:hypothetical protein B296_00033530 [Ensete ventricosum]RWW33625.1 hypothetical protein GW17_00001655 [Ensete ventricosum]RWW76218.1 hypothetical protein BHE74_00015697 [Ensete ventricosum]RZR85832.1 hypothetical protein BHM03_00012896 [Ensete ventricosum]
MQRKRKGCACFYVYSSHRICPSTIQRTLLSRCHHRKRVGTFQVPPYKYAASGAGTHRARASRSIKVHFFDPERTLDAYSSLG